MSPEMGRRLEQAIGALNGAVGDYLQRTSNGLATEMAFYHADKRLDLDAQSILAAHPDAGQKLVILVHGLMCTEHVWQFSVDGAVVDYGSLLAKDLGMTPFYVRYNSGLSIEDNGVTLAKLVERLVDAYPIPIESITLLGYSMGGLLLRGATKVGLERGYRFISLVRRSIYVGTPHLGAPLERWTRSLSKVLTRLDLPATRLAVELAALRSEGVKNLGDAHPFPLVPSIRHYLIAGLLSASSPPRTVVEGVEASPTFLADLIGDLLVPLPSATDGGVAAKTYSSLPAHVKVLRDIDHVGLAHHPEVYAHVRTWCAEEL